MGCTSSQQYVCPHDLPSRRTFSETSTSPSSLHSNDYSNLTSIHQLTYSPRSLSYKQLYRQKFITKISTVV